MAERDSLDWGSGEREEVKNPQARMKYWNDKTKKFLITDKECELCSGKLEWIGVQTFNVLKYQCTKCYKIVNTRKDK
jgi:hypothetical protein